MADRKDFYFRQKVTEAELDSAFDDFENADRNLMSDRGLYGINSGLTASEATPTPDLTVRVFSGNAYSQTGERLNVSALQIVDVSVDLTSTSTDVTTPGNSRIVSVFLAFSRTLSDLRVDGNGANVFFERDESFMFVVRQGAEAVTPTPPALQANEVLLVDITRTFGQTQIFNADLDFTRAEHMPVPVHLNVDNEITTLDEKVAPLHDDDIVMIEDSEDGFKTKKTKVASLAAAAATLSAVLAAGNVANPGQSIDFAATALTTASFARVNFAHEGDLIAGRNNANTADEPLVNWGTVADTAIFGPLGAGTEARVRGGASVALYTGGTSRISVDTSAVTVALDVQMGNNNISDANIVSSDFFRQEPIALASTAGFIRTRHGIQTITGRNNADTANRNLVSWGQFTVDQLLFGDASVDSLYFWTGGDINLRPSGSGSIEYIFNSTQADWTGNALINVGNVQIAANVPFVDINELDQVADQRLWRIISTASDFEVRALSDDQATQTTAIEIKRSTTTVTAVNVHSTLGMLGNEIVGIGGLDWTGTISTLGDANLPSGWSLYARDGLNTADWRIIDIDNDGTDRLTIGNTNRRLFLDGSSDANGTLIRIDGTTVVRVDVSQVRMTGTVDVANNPIIDIGRLDFNGTISTLGDVNTSQGWEIWSLDNALTTEVRLLAWGSDTSDVLTLGQTGTNHVDSVQLKAQSSVFITSPGGTEYNFTSTEAQWNNNALVGVASVAQNGTVAASGFVRTVNNPANGVAGSRNALNTADVQVITLDGSDNVVVGHATNAVDIVLTASGDIDFRPGGTNTLLATSTALEFATSVNIVGASSINNQIIGFNQLNLRTAAGDIEPEIELMMDAAPPSVGSRWKIAPTDAEFRLSRYDSSDGFLYHILRAAGGDVLSYVDFPKAFIRHNFLGFSTTTGIESFSISADEHNHDGAEAGVMRVTATTTGLGITGIVPNHGGFASRLLLIINVGSNAFALRDQDVGSTDTNRFDVSTGADFTLNPGESRWLYYDFNTTLRWRIVSE